MPPTPTPVPASESVTIPAPGHPWRWIIGVTFGLGLLCLIALLFNLFVDVPLRIAPETTYITEPLTSDGQWVDYFAAAEQRRYPPGMKTDDNGARIIVRELGVTYDELNPNEKRSVYKKLGLNPTLTPRVSYEGVWPFIIRHVADLQSRGVITDKYAADELREQLLQQSKRPWTADQLPMMQQWLEDNSPALDIISEAARRPVLCLPYAQEQRPGVSGMFMFNIMSTIQSYCESLATRAWHRIAIGDQDGAISDRVAIARLGRHLRETSHDSLNALKGLSMESLAGSIGIADSLEPPLSESQLRLMLQETGPIPAGDLMDKFIEFERYETLRVLQSFAQGDWSHFEEFYSMALPFNELPISKYGFDWPCAMRSANARFDSLSSGLPLPPVKPFAQHLLRRTRSIFLGDVIARGYFAFLPQLQDQLERAQRRHCLQRITLALLLYERQHGTLPPAFTVDPSGNRLHSWRVLILPQLGEQELYNRIRLDDPWNSSHNQQFHTAADHIYQAPLQNLIAGETTFAVVIGETTPFPGSSPRSLSDFGPGSEQMILILERSRPANWMAPHHEVSLAQATNFAEILDLQDPVSRSEFHLQGIHLGLRSTAIRFHNTEIAPNTLRAMLEGRASNSDH